MNRNLHLPVKLASFLILIALMAAPGVGWGQPWTYNFGTATGTFTSSTASTTFLPSPTSGTARVRVGTNPGAIEMVNPGLADLGTATELQITSNTGSTSTTKFSIYDYTPANVGYVKFKIAFNGGTNGVYNFWIGNGATYSDNTAIVAAQSFVGLRWSLGASNSITYNVLNNTTWGTTGITDPTTLFAQSTSIIYEVEVYANNSNVAVNYARNSSSYSLATDTWDLWVDGIRVGTGLASGGLANNGDFDSFAFNHQASATSPGTIYIDDIEYSNSLPAATSSAATPTFSPEAGTYNSPQNVEISSTTEGAAIYYTTDGSDPDNTDTEYTTAIPVSSTTTIKAIAYADGYDPSEIATATYTIITQFAVTFYVDMSNQTGFSTVDVAGSFNDWGNPGDVMTNAGSGIYTFTTAAVFTAGQEIQFKFRKNGEWATSEPDPNRTYTVVAGSNNEYHAVYGVMAPAEIGWANLQYPDMGTITAGGTYDVYSRVYMAGVTEPAGQGANISAWIGYSTTNTNPNTWTNWVAADYNTDDFNNDEYMATLGSGLTSGTYYYASRFQYKDLGYVYGGFNGGFWDGSTNVSGVLTVEAAPVVIPDVIISEVYGGGGNAGADYKNDFIELYNTTDSPVNIGGWSVQYYSATGTGTATAANMFVIPSGSIIKPKAHFLIQAAEGTGGTLDLPTPDAICTIGMGGTGGKVILYTTDAAQAISSTDLTSITGNPNFKDYVPYGTTAIPVWGSATVAVTNATSASRIAGSETYAYTQNIGNDFEVIAPNPRNSQQSYRSIADGLWADLATWETFFRGTDWIDAVALPLATDDVLVNHTINISSFANCKNLVIGTGSLSVANGGSFIPTGTVTGDVTVLRNIAGLNQYHFLSSPISNAALGNVFPAGDVLNIYLREYNEATGNWVNLAIPATLENGKGYSFFMDIANTTATFTGTLNNSNVLPMMSNSGTSGNTNYDGWNLLGNPFASAIQWGLGSWALNNVNNEVHVWSNGVYLSYAGGTGSLTDGIIPAQQGFFVKANAPVPSLTIPTASRLHSSQGFYKNNIADLLRLDVSDNSTYTDATFVRFNYDATEEFDQAFDAHKLDNDEAAPMLYTMHGETRFSINTLKSISETPEVPVYFKAGADGEYTINASGMESFENRIIYLTDLLTGLRQDLRENPVYAFNASTGDDANRFKLSFATVGIGEQPGLNIGVYAANGEIRLQLPEAMRGTVNVASLSGQILLSRNFSASGEFGIRTQLPAGIYLVTVVTDQGIATRKVFIN